MVVDTAAAATAGTLTGQPVAPRTTAVALPSLQHWRIQRAKLQHELATDAKVSLRSITRLEAGGKAGLDTVSRLAKALGVEPSQLLAPPPDA